MKAGPHVGAIVAALEEEGLSDLVDSLAVTRANVKRWWDVPKLYWFTDHTHTHSSRVAARARELSVARVLPVDVGLTGQESYLLEMASWVHDIGMQAVAAPGVDESEYSSDPDEVRSNHARASFNLIMNDVLLLGLPPNYDSTTQFIAWLALAHGTHTYGEAVETLRGIPRLNNKPVRGPLLASLLLMADEIDLHSERVRQHGAIEEYGVVSNAHWLKHECVDDVRVSEVDLGDGEMVQIELTLKHFRGMTAEQSTAVRQWITDKLLKQIALVEPEITIGFRNYFHFARDIDVKTSRLAGRTNPRLDERVIAVMEADNAKAMLINHSECHRRGSEALRASRTVVLVGEDVGLLENGREDIYSVLCAEHRASGGLLLNAPRDTGIGSHRTAADILGIWLTDAGVTENGGHVEHEIQRRSRLLSDIVGWMAEQAHPVLLAVSSLDVLADGERDWLLGQAVPVLQRNAAMLISSTRPFDGIPDCEQVLVGATSSEALERHLARYMSAPQAAKAVAAGTTYSTARRYAWRDVT